MWDGISILVGILLGMIIAIILFWLAFWSRTFIYTVCPLNQVACLYAEYWNDPGNAILEGSQVSDILFIDDGKMYYKRVPNTTSCIPVSLNQTVYIPFPQYCSFTVDQGQFAGTYSGKNITFNSPKYNFVLPDNSLATVITNENCIPRLSDPSIVTSGIPLLSWDPNPIIEI